MTAYQVKIFDRLGVCRARINLPFENDDEAINEVAEQGEGHLIEVWNGERLVKRFERT